MLFTLVINTAPISLHNGQAHSALLFAKTLIAQKHSIHRLFFYGEGIQNLNAQALPPQGEADLCQQWQAFINAHQLDAVVCIAAAIRRGVFDTTEANRHQRSAALAEGVSLSGLGQLIEATTTSDRTITFG
ncbi:MAG: sulfurtransferase complex subunit TusD [Marinagarivorans sp.]|nr:sulfurtransferase complex subunit TusD [Marinagarivorans sp.]